MKLVEVAKRQYQSLNGFGLIETFLRMIDLTAWLLRAKCESEWNAIGVFLLSRF